MPDWEPARRTAKKLRKIGISKVRGFMLNVTHYDWTAANIRHGIDLFVASVGHFVINTSQNGRGPVHYKAANGRRINIWCNPGMRGLAGLDHGHLALARRRLPVDQPARLRPELPGPQDRLVPAAGAHARALRHGLGEPAGGHPLSGTSGAIRRGVRRAPSSGACRNIRPLHTREPPATDDEVRLAALQYVRKISGYTKPSHANAEAFERAVDEVAEASARLLDSLVTPAPPKDREVEADKRKARSAQRYAAA